MNLASLDRLFGPADSPLPDRLGEDDVRWIVGVIASQPTGFVIDDAGQAWDVAEELNRVAKCDTSRVAAFRRACQGSTRWQATLETFGERNAKSPRCPPGSELPAMQPAPGTAKKLAQPAADSLF